MAQQQDIQLMCNVYSTIKLIYVCTFVHFVCFKWSYEFMTLFALLQITLSITVTSNAKSAQPAATSDGELSQREASDNGDNSDNGNNSDGGDYCSEGVPITDVLDLSSNGSVTLSTIKIEINRKNNTESLKTKLECIAATRKLMKSMCLSLFLLRVDTLYHLCLGCFLCLFFQMLV